MSGSRSDGNEDPDKGAGNGDSVKSARSEPDGGAEKERPFSETAVSAWLPEPVVAMFRRNGDAAWPQVEPLAVSDRS